MASFETDLQAPQGAGASVVAPVDTGFNVPQIFADLAGSLSQGLAQRQKEKAEEVKNAVVGEFAREYTAIEDGLISGQLKPEKANMLRRSLFSKYTANSPQYVKDFKEIQGAFFEGGAAVKGALNEEQAKLDEKRQLRKDAISSGMMFPDGMSQEFEDAQIRAFQANRAADDSFRRLSSRASEKREADAAAISTEKYAAGKQVQTELKFLAQEHFTPASIFAKDMANRAARGEDPAVLHQQANEYFSGIDASITQISASNPELAGAFRNMFNNILKNTQDGINGKERTAAQENELKEIQNKLILTALGNPRMQALWVQSKIFGGPIMINKVETEEAFGKLLQLADASGEFKAPPDLFRADDVTFKELLGREAALRDGKMVDKAGADLELSTIANNVNKTLASADVSSLTAKDLSGAADLYASPLFAERMKSNQVDKAEATKAKRVMGMVYDSELVRGVDQKLSSNFQFTGGKRSAKVSDLVNIQFSGAGVDFAMKDVGYLSPVDRQDQQQFARELKASKDAVNKLIHIGSHLEGHTNYEQYWEKNKHVLVPSLFTAPVEAQEQSPKVTPKAAAPKPATAPSKPSQGNWWESL